MASTFRFKTIPELSIQQHSTTQVKTYGMQKSHLNTYNIVL